MPEDMVATTPKPGTTPAAATGPRAYVQEAAGPVLLLALLLPLVIVGSRLAEGVVGTIDNLLKPYVISRGGSVLILMILFGVMGGIMAFGFIGIFLGPTLLAIGYSLIQEWGKDEDAPVPGGR